MPPIPGCVRVWLIWCVWSFGLAGARTLPLPDLVIAVDNCSVFMDVG